MVPRALTNEVRDRIMAAIGISGTATFYARMKGNPEPSHSEYLAITEIFQEYGITEPWEEE